MYNVCVHVYVVIDPVKCGAILKVSFIRMSWLEYIVTLGGQRDFEEIWYTVRDFIRNFLKGVDGRKIH